MTVESSARCRYNENRLIGIDFNHSKIAVPSWRIISVKIHNAIKPADVEKIMMVSTHAILEMVPKFII